MWLSVFRFIGSNLAGLGAGYFVSDIWSDIKPTTPAPGQMVQKPGSYFTEAIRNFTGWPKWIAAILGLVLLIIVADRLGYLRKK